MALFISSFIMSGFSNGKTIKTWGTNVYKRLENLLPGVKPGDAATVSQLDPTSETVTQATNISTGVTINAKKGLITTQSASAGAAGATPNTFTVTNSYAGTSSNISAYIVNYAGTIATNGNPFVIVDNRTAGTFDIIISNAHGTNALSGALVIGFEVKN